MTDVLTGKNSAKERLKEYLAIHKLKIARTKQELYAHSIQDDGGEEVDEFLQMLEGEKGKIGDSHRKLN